MYILTPIQRYDSLYLQFHDIINSFTLKQLLPQDLRYYSMHKVKVSNQPLDATFLVLIDLAKPRLKIAYNRKRAIKLYNYTGDDTKSSSRNEKDEEDDDDDEEEYTEA